MSFKDEHAIETYKSLISFSTELLRSLLLLNGGAIVALLAYLGQAKEGTILALYVKCPLTWFVIGLNLVPLAFIFSYLTQLALFDETVRSRRYKVFNYKFFFWVVIALVSVSIVMFSVGAFSGIDVLSKRNTA